MDRLFLLGKYCPFGVRQTPTQIFASMKSISCGAPTLTTCRDSKPDYSSLMFRSFMSLLSFWISFRRNVENSSDVMGLDSPPILVK